MEDHRRQQETDALGTPVNGPREASGLSGQVEVEIQLEKVVKDIASHTANSLLGHARKDGVPDLLEYSGCDPCCSVYHRFFQYSSPSTDGIGHTSNDHCTTNSPCCPRNSSEIDIHRINDAFEIEWHLNIQNLAYV